MAASEALNFLKLTDSENTPAGTDTIGTSLDDELRSLKANVARSARWETTATVSSAAALTRTGLHKVIPLDGTTAAFDLTLPDATDGSMTGFATVFYKSDTSANAVTLNASGSQTINGALTLALSKQYDSVMLVSDAANWHVASSNRNTVGALTVEGTASFSATAIFKAAVLMEDTLTVSGTAVMKTALTVEGVADFAGSVTVGTITASATAVFKSSAIFEGPANTTITSLTCDTTTAIDFADSNDFTLTLDQNTTLGEPGNQTPGQSGVIYIIQDSTARTLAFHADWQFAEGTAPTISTGSGAVDVIAYHVRADNFVAASLVGLAFA